MPISVLRYHLRACIRTNAQSGHVTKNSLAHKFITLHKHKKKLKSLQISVKQQGKADTRVLEHDIDLPKHREYVLLTTEPLANQRSRTGQVAVVCQE